MVASNGQTDEFQKRLDALLGAEAPPPNPFVAYLVEQLNASVAEAKVVEHNINQVNAQLNELHQKRLVLQGDRNRLITDIQKWDRPEQPRNYPEQPLDD
jgi:hypothetical protein